MKNKVTIQDIADALGISRNTVSKAINNSDGLAEATRERILNKAVEMGYKQFSYVTSLAKTAQSAPSENHVLNGFQGEIALFTTMFLTQSHFASLMLDKFQQEITLLGYTLNTHRVTPENLRDGSLPITFIPERCSAIICIEMFDRSYDEMVCELGIPVLFVDGPSKHDGISLPADQLYMDNTTEITRFVLDMLEKGYRRIGWIGQYHHCQSFFERYSAFRLAMLMEDVPVDSRFIIDYNEDDGLLQALTDLPELPDLFVCANDFVARDSMRILAAMGKKVPQDVMICGFDDSAESRMTDPPLTTVHIHTQIMAFAAMHLLMTRIREPSLDFRTVHTEADLIYRASTGD